MEKEVKQNVEAKGNEKAKKANKNKKPFFLVRWAKAIGRKFREIFLELKKVTWPSFGKVVKETGVVLAVCLFFMVVITAFDLGLGELVRLVTNIGK
ncbi:MAG: preprotein translocase subunit SecE [Clostridia bacterium]|nr:preprotein translocase subunit SecE [Clostridia bacterium]